MARKAFSYARFSTSEQLDGRSLRRQEEAAKAYCVRHGLALDERSFRDLGISGFKGGNATAGALADFLEMARDGRVPKGSVLIVENIDRLSRLPPHEANQVIIDLVQAGVEIVTIAPEQSYTAANIGKVATWIPLQVAQALAHEESVKKSGRMLDAWGAKRQTAADRKLTKKGPAWLKLTADGAGWTVLEQRAEWVRSMFRWCLEGLGVSAIAGRLNRQAPAGLTGKGWTPAYVRCLLRSRSVLGEYQPHAGTCAKRGTKATRKPVGEPVKGYFPAIVAEADFYAVQRLLDGRRKGGGRIKGVPNLFRDLIVDARDGESMVINTTNGRKVLVSSGAVRRKPGCEFRSVPYDVFEAAFLRRLRELKPADLRSRPNGEEDLVALWSGRLTVVNQKIAQTKARAAKEPDVGVFLDLLGELDGQRREIIAQLDKARSAAASKDADVLGDAQSLAALLAGAEPGERDGLRRKVRARLRQLVQSMHVLIVPRGRARLVAVQCWFADGKRHRDYAILHSPAQARGNAPARPAQTAVLSFAALAAAADLDLRRPRDVRQLERALAEVELAGPG